MFSIGCQNGNALEEAQSHMDGEVAPKSGKADISITIEGLGQTSCRLGGIYGDQYFNVDSLKSDANGTIKIEQDTALAGGLYFVILPDNKTFLQFLAGDDQEFSMRTSMAHIVEDMVVEGSDDNKAYYESLNYEARIQAELDGITARMNGLDKNSDAYKKLDQQRMDIIDKRVRFVEDITKKYAHTFFAKFKLAGQNPELQDIRNPDGTKNEAAQVYQYVQDFWNNVDFSDQRLLRTPVYHNKLDRFITKLVVQSGDSLTKYADFITRKSMANKELFKYTANYIAIKYRDAKIMDWEKVFAHMVENFFTYDLAFWSDSTEIYRLQTQIIPMKASVIGATGRNLTVPNDKGGMSSLYDIKKPFTLLYIFNPSCDNCQKETPELIKVYNEWKNRGLEVFALCIDGEESEWRDFMQKYDVPWSYNAFDPTNKSLYGNYYQIDHTPEIYVLNKDKKIIGKNLKAFQVPTIIERELARTSM